MNVGLGLVFVAGVVSFLSPCVFSMVPVYLGILGANAPANDNMEGKGSLLLLGLLFVFGFTLVFITLGLTTTVLGNLFIILKPWIARVGSLLIFIYGLHLTGLIHIPVLDFEWKPLRKTESGSPSLNAFLMGIIFSTGWSPCIGPILGAILTAIATNQVSPLQSVYYLLIYSLGMGIPFLAAALGLQPLLDRAKRVPNLTKRIQQISGGLLALFGVLLMLGLISRLAQVSPKWLL